MKILIENNKRLGIKTNQLCSNCNKELYLIIVSNKQVCKNCYVNRKHKQGHAGFTSLSKEVLDDFLSTKRITYYCNRNKEKDKNNIVELLQVSKADKVFASLYLSHYPKSKGIMGRTFNYLVIDNRTDLISGIIGANSPPYSIQSMDRYFEITNENRSKRVNSFLNNNVFRLINSDKNFGTQVLKEFRKRIQKDYFIKYNEKLKGLITFVEPPRKGTVYLADNWKYLGKTKGIKVIRSYQESKCYATKPEEQYQKLIFGYKFKNYHDW